MMKTTPVGKTKSQGWEIGVRRTLPISPQKAWALLTTQPGLGYWLGYDVEPPFQTGAAYQTREGTKGNFKSYHEGSLIRLTWHPAHWEVASTLQIRVIPAKTGATISFHQEKLSDGEQREAMRQHWSGILDQLADLIQRDI